MIQHSDQYHDTANCMALAQYDTPDIFLISILQLYSLAKEEQSSLGHSNYQNGSALMSFACISW